MHVEHTSFEGCAGCQDHKSQLRGIGTQQLHWSALGDHFRSARMPTMLIIYNCFPYHLFVRFALHCRSVLLRLGECCQGVEPRKRDLKGDWGAKAPCLQQGGLSGTGGVKPSQRVGWLALGSHLFARICDAACWSGLWVGSVALNSAIALMQHAGRQ